MTIDAIRKRDLDYPTDDAAPESRPQTKEPDFSAHASVQLPTGLITSRASFAARVADLRTNVEALKNDLKSPEIAKYCSSSASLYYAYVKVNVTVGQLASALSSMASGDGKEALRALTQAIDLPTKISALVQAHHDFQRANGPKTNEAFAKVLRDAFAVQSSMMKLSIGL